MCDNVSFIRRPIVSGEAGFHNVIRWPSYNGTMEEYFQGVATLNNKDNGQLATIGLKEGHIHEEDLKDHDSSDITAFLHMIGSRDVPIKASEVTWNKIRKIDSKGRKPGVYYISYPDTYLIVI